MAKKIRTVASILRGIKRTARKKPRTQKQKELYLEGMAKKMDKKPTAPEILFKTLLEELGVKYETQKIVGGKIYDFYIPGKNMLIEADGVYWHSKNKELKEMTSVQKKIFFNDLRKNSIAKNLGYELERVWEDDLKQKYEEVKFRFAQILF